VQTPRVFFAECSADGTAVNLVFEDLSVCCEPGDQATGCTPAQAMTVIEQLALLHRHYWTKPSLADLPWTANRRQPESDLKDLYASGASVFIDRYQHALSINDCETIDAFVPLAEVWRKQSVSAPTLLHGDARLDNVMFKKAPDTAPSAYLLDWQCARVGDAQSDVAYFLSGSLASSDRATHERDLIAAHAQIIRGIDPDYTTERALTAYQANTVSGLYLTVVAATALPHTRTSEKLLTALVARNCAAVRDWNALEVIERSR
jgi:Phosphotransferase enzyme family